MKVRRLLGFYVNTKEMRKAKIFYKDEEAGCLTQQDDGSFIFRYHDSWMHDDNKPAISLSLTKQQQTHHSKYLFPFFFNMLPEGSNKYWLSKHFRIDQDDYFGLLVNIAKDDTIGAVRVAKIENE